MIVHVTTADLTTDAELDDFWQATVLGLGGSSRIFWQRADRFVIRIADMSDEHLGNALRLVARELHGRVHPGLVQEWRRRGLEEDGWRDRSGALAVPEAFVGVDLAAGPDRCMVIRRTGR